MNKETRNNVGEPQKHTELKKRSTQRYLLFHSHWGCALLNHRNTSRETHQLATVSLWEHHTVYSTQTGLAVMSLGDTVLGDHHHLCSRHQLKCHLVCLHLKFYNRQTHLWG